MSLWASPWARSLTLTFQRLAFPSTTAVGTHGFSCRQARKCLTKIPLDHKLLPYRIEVEVTPSPVKCPEISEVLTCKVRTRRFTPTFTTRRRHGKPLWPSTVDY
jgi:hypothetical protein